MTLCNFFAFIPNTRPFTQIPFLMKTPDLLLSGLSRGSLPKAYRMMLTSLSLMCLVACDKKADTAATEAAKAEDKTGKACCDDLPARFPVAAAGGDTATAGPGSGAAADGGNASANPGSPAPVGMVWIQGGEFTMGTDEEEAYQPEKPAHRVKVDGFYMDETEVTNEMFAKFVEATGYVTVAEKKPDWEAMKKTLPPGTPEPSPDVMVAASLVFQPPSHQVPLNDITQWWVWVPGANWRHPEGPGSDLKGRENHPVVHVCWDDAMAYCQWAGKRLPTEAEWEYACRGGLEKKRYAWGDDFRPGEVWMANTFQGSFPDVNTGADGHMRTAAVKQFPANGYGLYDMIGNVWEWCSDWYRADEYPRRAGKATIDNPKGPSDFLIRKSR
jgi:formylglycine-generating enzyme